MTQDQLWNWLLQTWDGGFILGALSGVFAVLWTSPKNPVWKTLRSK